MVYIKNILGVVYARKRQLFILCNHAFTTSLKLMVNMLNLQPYIDPFFVTVHCQKDSRALKKYEQKQFLGKHLLIDSNLRQLSLSCRQIMILRLCNPFLADIGSCCRCQNAQLTEYVIFILRFC